MPFYLLPTRIPAPNPVPIDLMSLPAVCCVCGAPLTIENLGALVPDEEEKEKAYCEKCKLKAVDDYGDWSKQIGELR